MSFRLPLALSLLVFGPLGCSTKIDPFAPVPECKGAAVVPFMGSRQIVLSSLAIGDAGEGFDLNLDGKIDNKLSALSVLANPDLMKSFNTNRNVVIGVETFGYNGEADNACVKLAFYLAQVNKNRDGDGKNTSPNDHDCLDIDAAVPGSEDLTNGLDDDCDGFADNATVGSKPTTNTRLDMDGDGVTVAQGDCDDRNDTPEHMTLAASRHPGAKDICDDGIDQDCDGIPDNDPSCNPFTTNNVKIDITKDSFKDPTAAALQPYIAFTSGSVTSNALKAGPSLFQVSVPLSGFNVNLELSGARLSGTFVDAGGKTNFKDGLLGGVLEARSLAQVKGISASGIVFPEQSLLDALFGGSTGATLLGLEQDADGHYRPDIDVDGDGLESFWIETMPAAGKPGFIDHCKDGDGSVVVSTADLPCALAKDAKGNFRFVDGLSATLKFNGVPAQFNPTLVTRLP